MRPVKLTPEEVINLINLYWQYGKMSGIRPDILFSQCMKETGFLTFERPDGSPGSVGVGHRNLAGIKTAAGGANEDPLAHERFATVEDGVRAHLNHMAGYTGLAALGTPHPRYHVVLTTPWAGTIRTVEELGGRWAPNPDYGHSIVRDYLAPMIATVAPVAVEEVAPVAEVIPITVIIDGVEVPCNAVNRDGWAHADLEPFLLRLQRYGDTTDYDWATRTLKITSPIRFAPEGG